MKLELTLHIDEIHLYISIMYVAIYKVIGKLL